MKICPDCHKVVSAKEAVELGGRYYHRACRTCSKCGELIRPLRGRIVSGGKVYHALCALRPEYCSVCGRPVGNPQKNFWGEPACADHSERCFYCDRFIGDFARDSRRSRYAHVQDGADRTFDVNICGCCKATVVRRTEEIEGCRQAVMALFRVNGIVGIPDDIPITLTDRFDEVSTSVTGNMLGLNCSAISASRSRYSCEIFIRAGLPRIFFKGVLAHELLHSWLLLYAIDLPSAEKEGFCNLGKFLVLKNEKDHGAQYMISYFLETNSDPVYGGGYRLMKKRLEKLGWRGLMDALRWESKPSE